MALLMSRKKDRTLWQHRFNLSSDSAEQERLHEFLSQLAGEDGATAWMIEKLIAAMLDEDMPASKLRRSAPVIPYPHPPRRMPRPEVEEDDGDVTYEDVNE